MHLMCWDLRLAAKSSSLGEAAVLLERFVKQEMIKACNPGYAAW